MSNGPHAYATDGNYTANVGGTIVEVNGVAYAPVDFFHHLHSAHLDVHERADISKLKVYSSSSQVEFGPSSGFNNVLSVAVPAANRTTTLGDIGANGTILQTGWGAGGKVTQATSVSTAVTLNAPIGQITMQGVVTSSDATFTLNNTFITSASAVLAWVGNTQSTTDFLSPVVTVGSIASGSCAITVTNNSSNSTGAAPIVNFIII